MDVALKEPFDREKQFASKRQAVILAAGQAFRRRGYHNAPMTEIAANLGLTKAALYYYVRNKDCLLYTSPSPRDRTRSRMPSSA